MHNYKKSVKLTLTFTYIFMALLLALVIALPMLVTWYVEIKGRDQNLPATIMLICYPCVPFAATILFSLRRILLNVLSGLIFGDRNISLLKRITICGGAIAFISLIAGHFYMPFYIVSALSAFCALAVKTVKDIFSAELANKREKIYEDIKEDYDEENSNICNR